MRFSISTIFLCCLKDSTWAPYEQVKTVCELFWFCKDLRLQSSKIAYPGSQRLRRHANFSLDTDIFIFLNYCILFTQKKKKKVGTFFHLIVPSWCPHGQ